MHRVAITVLTAAVAVIAAACAEPIKEPPVPGEVYDILCPVTGEVSFSNDWHAPRAGGLLHEGNDIFAPRGRANVAVVDGDARFRTGARSGKAIWLDGDDGNDYFYAHFDAWEGTDPDREVKAGDVIGYTGNTGDAASTPTHTHFEIHDGRLEGEAVNPYPTLLEVCTDRTGVSAAEHTHVGDVPSGEADGLEP